MTYKSIDVGKLYEAFLYDRCSGKLFWKTRPERHFTSAASCTTWNKRFAGKEAGTLHISKKSKTTYRMVKVFGSMILVHLIVWAMEYGNWPDNTIDHIDRDGCNNVLSNLREVNQTGQLKNRNKSSSNTSGVKGVAWHKQTSKWQVRININGIETYLGTFETFEDAVNVRLEAERKNGYDPQGVK